MIGTLKQIQQLRIDNYGQMNVVIANDAKVAVACWKSIW